ncbi:MAG: type II toxin-antitoxin system YafQ family toxin [Micrococcales bacterium]|nr:type II toxin-antitoxin system YafQ family toxin [Micrococcales bacterium]
MRTIRYQAQFRKDYKKLTRQGRSAAILQHAAETLRTGGILADRAHDHALSGDYPGCRECHLAPDWLLIYRIDETENELILIRTGSHSELFG